MKNFLDDISKYNNNYTMALVIQMLRLKMNKLNMYLVSIHSID